MRYSCRYRIPLESCSGPHDHHIREQSTIIARHRASLREEVPNFVRTVHYTKQTVIP